MNDFEQFWAIYENSFPPEERREQTAQKMIFNNNRYNLLPFYVHDFLAAFIAYWDLDSFLYFEHFAVREDLRGQGLGEKILKQILKGKKEKIILEVELPNEEKRKRRVNFYRRLGFYLNRYSYFQPPYVQGGEKIPMYLMSYPEPINTANLEVIRGKIYKTVYQYSY